MKRLLAFILVLAMLFTMAGCEDKAEKGRAHREAGFAAMEQGDYETALKEFEKALEYMPNNVSTRVGMIEIYTAQCDLDKVRELAEELQNAEKPRGRLEENADGMTVYLLDPRGMQESAYVYNSDGSLRCTWEYEGNHDTFVVETGRCYSPEGVLLETAKYDSKGNLYRTERVHPNGQVACVLTYSKEGWLFKEEHMREDGTSSKIVEYNADGDVLGTTTCRADGSKEETLVHDDQDRVIERTWYGKSGELLRRFEYKYDETGHMVEYIYDEENELSASKEMLPDGTQRTNYLLSTGELSRYSIITFDKDGNQLEIRDYFPDGSKYVELPK